LAQSILLITPPFTQLNTPYPATIYLKGFLNTRNIVSNQADLGIEVILALFSKDGLSALFGEINHSKGKLSKNGRRMIGLSDQYIRTIDQVIGFLQGKNPSLAYLICQGNYLPEGLRFKNQDDLEWAFGTMGIQDKAKHLATLYLEDISDLIVEGIDPHFGFSRYAERLGRSASVFDDLEREVERESGFIDKLLIELLAKKIGLYKPTLVGLSVPFPGNLYCALKCGQWIRKNHPEIKIVIGGGFANTELRSLSDSRIFNYIDFITLDDGESPLEQLIRYLDREIGPTGLRRTFTLDQGKVTYFEGSQDYDVHQKDVGTPDYSDLSLDKYLSVIQIANPMHRLWSDGRWNKLTLAHGCYWSGCTFCDTSLDYIKRYEPNTARLICDRIEEIIRQTGESGFHFVDEAASPGLLRSLAQEIIQRKLTVVWWTNIRFEKNFTRELCSLLKESGCIAISGGLEVASDRLLKLINKGVTVDQVARVAANFTECGIMVHAYLMYGFPTQTIRETIDSLEVVRQLFELGLVQSGFWHHFALTAHSPVGQHPGKFGIIRDTMVEEPFANNDLTFTDPTGCDHDAFSDGLGKSLFNYMHGIGYELPLSEWFNFEIPETTIEHDYIEKIISKR
jgi:radical SAM superfamily enzyme YgiQ (UPF0313 family)